MGCGLGLGLGFGIGLGLGLVFVGCRLHQVGEHARRALGDAAEDLEVEVRVGRLRVLRVELARAVADELNAQAAEEREHLVRVSVRVRVRVRGRGRG